MAVSYDFEEYIVLSNLERNSKDINGYTVLSNLERYSNDINLENTVMISILKDNCQMTDSLTTSKPCYPYSRSLQQL